MSIVRVSTGEGLVVTLWYRKQAAYICHCSGIFTVNDMDPHARIVCRTPIATSYLLTTVVLCSVSKIRLEFIKLKRLTIIIPQLEKQQPLMHCPMSGGYYSCNGGQVPNSNSDSY